MLTIKLNTNREVLFSFVFLENYPLHFNMVIYILNYDPTSIIIIVLLCTIVVNWKPSIKYI